MSNRRELELRKARLLSEIQQQRIDLSANRRAWLLATSVYDRGWNTFLSFRSYVAIGSSLMAIWSVRHPGLVFRWAKRGVGVWSTWKLVRNAIQNKAR